MYWDTRVSLLNAELGEPMDDASDAVMDAYPLSFTSLHDGMPDITGVHGASLAEGQKLEEVDYPELQFIGSSSRAYPSRSLPKPHEGRS